MKKVSKVQKLINCKKSNLIIYYFFILGCPNKYNIHHVCSLFCLEKYGEGNDNVPLRIIKRFRRLLVRYPLQKDWVHIWDAGCGAYYFWNKLDDTVSWLPPKHPKAVISKSAATLRRESDRPDFTETPDDDDSATAASHQPSMMPNQSSNSPPHILDEIPERYVKPAPVYKKTKSRDIEKILRTKKGRRQYHESSEKLDPMDPAAYSDCARGKWSSGLNPEERNAADTTASGALFQSRPYPSPGEVLRVNKGGAGKRSHTDDEENKSDSEQRKQPKFQATLEDAEGNSSDDYNSD